MREAEQQNNVLEEEPESVGPGGGDGSLAGLLDSLKEAGDETVSVRDILAAFEHRSVGALISVLALIAALPIIGGIPGMSITTATLILLVVGHSLFSKHGGIWVPDWLGRREISADKVEKSVDASRPYVRRVDRWIKPRLEWLTRGRTKRLFIVAAIVLLTITFYPLAFVPWGVTAPSLGVLALGIALMAGDGYFALFGYAMIAATAATALMLLGGGGAG